MLWTIIADGRLLCSRATTAEAAPVLDAAMATGRKCAVYARIVNHGRTHKAA